MSYIWFSVILIKYLHAKRYCSVHSWHRIHTYTFVCSREIRSNCSYKKVLHVQIWLFAVCFCFRSINRERERDTEKMLIKQQWSAESCSQAHPMNDTHLTLFDLPSQRVFFSSNLITQWSSKPQHMNRHTISDASNSERWRRKWKHGNLLKAKSLTKSTCHCIASIEYEVQQTIFNSIFSWINIVEWSAAAVFSSVARANEGMKRNSRTIYWRSLYIFFSAFCHDNKRRNNERKFSFFSTKWGMY